MVNSNKYELYPIFNIKPSSSVQFSHSVISDSLRPHEPQHSRPPCLSPTPGVYSSSRPLSRWCHPTISPSVVPFSSCLTGQLQLLSQPSWKFPWHSVSHWDLGTGGSGPHELSKPAAQTSSGNSVRSANSWASSQIIWIRISEVGSSNLCLRKMKQTTNE